MLILQLSEAIIIRRRVDIIIRIATNIAINLQVQKQYDKSKYVYISTHGYIRWDDQLHPELDLTPFW